MRSNVTSFMPFRAALLALAVGTAVAVSGCGNDKMSTRPVTGTVLVNKKPAAGAMVIFCPTSGSEELMKMRPFGVVGADGKFELTSFDKGDGLPEGDYKVLVRWPASSSGNQVDGTVSMTGPDRLRGKYMNLEKTPLSVKVESSTSELPPFELQM